MREREREREHMYDVSRTFNEMPYMCVSYSLMESGPVDVGIYVLLLIL